LEEIEEIEEAEPVDELEEIEEAPEAEPVDELEDGFLGEIVVDDDVAEILREEEWKAREDEALEERDEPAEASPIEAVEHSETPPAGDAEVRHEGDRPASNDWLRVEQTLLEIEDGVDSELPEEIVSAQVTDDGVSVVHVEADEELEELDDASEDIGEAVEVAEVEELEEFEELDQAEERRPPEETDEPEEVQELEELEESGAADEVEELDVVTEEEPELLPVDMAEEVEELSEVEVEDDSVSPAVLLDHSPRPFLSSATSFGGAFMRPSADTAEEGHRSHFTPVFRADELGLEKIVIHGLDNSSSYQVVELDDFIAFAGKTQTIIEEREGLAQIQATAYFDESRNVDQRILGLAEQVLHRRSLGGIEDVLGGAFDDIDFGDLFDGELQQGSGNGGDETGRTLRFVSGGFELPYTNESGDAGVRRVYRELVTLTRQWDARVAVILEPVDGGFASSFTLGMPAECPESFTLPGHSDIVRNVCSYRRVALLKQRLGRFRDFGETCHARKLASVGSWLFLPLNTGTGSYLVIGFTRSFEDLLDLTSRYEIVSRAG
ncbi:MAG: hypothetical protein ACOCYQ_06480, partial [Alkalispirochaeta sp.]